jgi:hypothetical protein
VDIRKEMVEKYEEYYNDVTVIDAAFSTSNDSDEKKVLAGKRMARMDEYDEYLRGVDKRMQEKLSGKR